MNTKNHRSLLEGTGKSWDLAKATMAMALALLTGGTLAGSVDLLPREQYPLPVLQGGECVNPGRVLATR